MSFESDLDAFTRRVAQRERTIFTNVVSAVKDSIVTGSPVTASPGQPVDTGALKASWIVGFDSPGRATISTNLAYAPVIEDGIGAHGPLTLRSQVGGFHSVKLTVAGFERVVEAETRAVTG